MSLTDPQQQQKLLDEPEPFRDRVTSCNARIVDTASEPRKRFISYNEPTETAAAGTGDDDQQSRQAQTQQFLSSYRLNTAANRSALLERPFLSTLELYASKHTDKNVWSQQNLAKSISRKSVNEMNRPLSKLGIFYPGSTASLSRRAAARRKINATSEPVSQVEQQQPAEEKEKEKEHQVESGLKPVEEESDAENWKDGIRAALYSMLDLSLFSSPTFIILAISGFLTLCCLFVPFLYLGEQASKLGVSKEGQAFLLTSLGVINIVGRIICGIISDLPSVDPLVVSNVAIISGGIGTFCVPLLTQYWMYLVYTVPFALAVAAFSALRSVICVELLGLERLSNAFGLMLLFMGIAGLVGPPTAAILKDLTGNFDLSFYLMGTLLTLSGVICIPLRRISNYEQRKQRKYSLTVSGNGKTQQQQQAELEPLTKNDETGAEPATNGTTAENVKSTTDHV